MTPIYVTFKTEFVEYRLRVASKVTVIRGDSASGKTVLKEYVCDSKSAIEKPCPVIEYIPVDGVDPVAILSAYEKGSIVFLDEDAVAEMVENRKLNAAWHLPLYFVLITRLPLDDIQFGLSDVYKLQTETGVTTTVPMYPKFDKLPDAEIYVSEDSGSGNQYWSAYLQTADPMGGNRGWNNCGDGCLIMDGSALGSEIDKVLDAGKQSFAPQSFEYLLLRHYTKLTAEDFVHLLRPDHLTYERLFDSLCCSTVEYLGFKYSKRSLPKCVLREALIPEFTEREPTRYYEELKKTRYFDGALEKCNANDIIRECLTELGASDYYTAVYANLPDILEADSFLETVLYALKIS